MNDAERENVPLTVLAREDEAWRALSAGTGADFYRRNLTDDALMVFPFGVLDRAATIAAIDAAPPWAWFRIDEPKVVRLAADAALLTYRATAQRAGQAPYTAFMTTVFVRRDGTWKTAFHQQTPRDA